MKLSRIPWKCFDLLYCGVRLDCSLQLRYGFVIFVSQSCVEWKKSVCTGAVPWEASGLQCRGKPFGKEGRGGISGAADMFLT